MLYFYWRLENPGYSNWIADSIKSVLYRKVAGLGVYVDGLHIPPSKSSSRMVREALRPTRFQSQYHGSSYEAALILALSILL